MTDIYVLRVSFGPNTAESEICTRYCRVKGKVTEVTETTLFTNILQQKPKCSETMKSKQNKEQLDPKS